MAIISSNQNSERPMMNCESELNNIAKNKLVQLLDYVSHQAKDTQKSSMKLMAVDFILMS